MPRTIGKYEILNTLGSGAMGVVYRAHDPVMDRIVALKVLSPGLVENARQRERFYQEARTAGRLRHPNILVIYDCGEDQGVPYIVMEYLEGEDLRDVIGAGLDWPLERKLDFVAQICRGLSQAHQKNVVHRDVKPGNIRVLPDGSAKIMDFGIARLGDTSSQTQTGAILGTVAYMAPEQCQSAQVTGASDIWSVGVILFELLTGHRPFEADNNIAMIHRIVTNQPARLSRYLANCPAELEQIVSRALAKEPVDRYQRADDMQADIEKLLLDIRLNGPIDIGMNPVTLPGPPPAAPGPERAQEDDSLVVTREVHQAAACIEAGQYQEAERLIDHLSMTDIDAVIVSSLRATLERHREQTGVGMTPEPAPAEPAESAPIEESVAAAAPGIDVEPLPRPVQEPEQPLADSFVPEETPPSEPFLEPPPAELPFPGPPSMPEETVRYQAADSAVAESPWPADPVPDVGEPPSSPAGLTEIQPVRPEIPAPRVRFQPARPVSRPDRRPLLAIAGGIVVLAVIGFGLYRAFFAGSGADSTQPPSETKQETVITAAVTQSVSLNVLPWAEIVEVTQKGSGRKLADLQGKFTPLRLDLPEGEYVFRVRNDAMGRELTFSVGVTPGRPLQFVKSFVEFDPKAAATEFGIQ